MSYLSEPTKDGQPLASDCVPDRRSGFAWRLARYWAQSDVRVLSMLLPVMLLSYGVMLIGPSPPRVEKQELTFNSMLDYLLHGHFDVDPNIVGLEGYLRNGHTYAYWGIWCALLRLPLWVFHRMDTDVTPLSCLAAVCLAALTKMRTVLLLQRHGGSDQASKRAVEMMQGYILLGGSEIAYLRSSIFQEVVFWAVAFAAIFVYLAIKGVVMQRFGTGTLSGMALCAGLALLTRVSTGIGLIAALALLLLVLAWQSDGGGVGKSVLRMRKMLGAFLEPRMLVPIGIVALFMVATGFVNYSRWGNPLTFADYKAYLMAKAYPDQLPRLAEYGLFNLRRIPFGLMYYFFPAWAVRSSSGNFLFEQTQTRLFNDVELPPSSFFLTDLLPLCFILFLVVVLWRRRWSLARVGHVAAVAGGLLAPWVLMLTAIALTYRYRMEFYPEIDFLAFLGLYAILTDEKLRAVYARRRVWMEAALIVSIVSSIGAVILYRKAPFGPAQILLHNGLVHGRHFVF